MWREEESGRLAYRGGGRQTEGNRYANLKRSLLASELTSRNESHGNKIQSSDSAFGVGGFYNW